jgi:hypothetical protein
MKFVKLEQRYNQLMVDNEEVVAKLNAYEDLERDGSDIRTNRKTHCLYSPLSSFF